MAKENLSFSENREKFLEAAFICSCEGMVSASKLKEGDPNHVNDDEQLFELDNLLEGIECGGLDDRLKERISREFTLSVSINLECLRRMPFDIFPTNEFIRLSTIVQGASENNALRLLKKIFSSNDFNHRGRSLFIRLISSLNTLKELSQRCTANRLAYNGLVNMYAKFLIPPHLLLLCDHGDNDREARMLKDANDILVAIISGSKTLFGLDRSMNSSRMCTSDSKIASANFSKGSPVLLMSARNSKPALSHDRPAAVFTLVPSAAPSEHSVSCSPDIMDCRTDSVCVTPDPVNETGGVMRTTDDTEYSAPTNFRGRCVHIMSTGSDHDLPERNGDSRKPEPPVEGRSRFPVPRRSSAPLRHSSEVSESLCETAIPPPLVVVSVDDEQRIQAAFEASRFGEVGASSGDQLQTGTSTADRIGDSDARQTTSAGGPEGGPPAGPMDPPGRVGLSGIDGGPQSAQSRHGVSSNGGQAERRTLVTVPRRRRGSAPAIFGLPLAMGDSSPGRDNVAVPKSRRLPLLSAGEVLRANSKGVEGGGGGKVSGGRVAEEIDPGVLQDSHKVNSRDASPTLPPHLRGRSISPRELLPPPSSSPAFQESPLAPPQVTFACSLSPEEGVRRGRRRSSARQDEEAAIAAAAAGCVNLRASMDSEKERDRVGGGGAGGGGGSKKRRTPADKAFRPRPPLGLAPLGWLVPRPFRTVEARLRTFEALPLAGGWDYAALADAGFYRAKGPRPSRWFCCVAQRPNGPDPRWPRPEDLGLGGAPMPPWARRQRRLSDVTADATAAAAAAAAASRQPLYVRTFCCEARAMLTTPTRSPLRLHLDLWPACRWACIASLAAGPPLPPPCPRRLSMLMASTSPNEPPLTMLLAAYSGPPQTASLTDEGLRPQPAAV